MATSVYVVIRETEGRRQPVLVSAKTGRPLRRGFDGLAAFGCLYAEHVSEAEIRAAGERMADRLGCHVEVSR